MNMQVLTINEINAISGGMALSQSQPLCRFVGANGKCEDAYTTPPTIPPSVLVLF
jgi:hypothetical protein